MSARNSATSSPSVPAAVDLPLDRIDELIDEHRAGVTELGLVWGVVRHGELVAGGARGERRPGGDAPDATTVFRIASMTKSFTAATVLLLRDDGLLRLDDEVVRYVPEVAGLVPPTDDAPAPTVRSLLTMTAGFPTDDPWGDRQQDLPDDDFAALLRRGLSLAWTPGTAWEYSNLGYALLGRVVTAAAGRPYREVVTERLLRPLGMTSTVFAAEDADPAALAVGHRRGGGGWQEVPFAGYGAFAPMGGLFSTVADLARWVGGMTSAFPPRDGADDLPHPLRRASRRELQQPHRGLAPSVGWRSITAAPLVRGQAYGFGLLVETDPVVGTIVSHSGGYPGFGSHMRWHPASGLGVVVLANGTYAPAGRLGTLVMDSLLSEPHPAVPHPTVPQPTVAQPTVAHPAVPHPAVPHPAVPHPAVRRPTVPHPAPVEPPMRAATLAAVEAVTGLLTAWDDDVADSLLSMNVDLDEPRTERRARIDALRELYGPWTPEEGSLTLPTPAHAVWWLAGVLGRVRVEIKLDAQLPPKVQGLTLREVPDPPDDVAAIADRIVAALAAPDPRWPGADLHLAGEPDVAEATALLRATAAWLGAAPDAPVSVEGVTAGDGLQTATFTLRGPQARVSLSLAYDRATRVVTDLSVVPV